MQLARIATLAVAVLASACASLPPPPAEQVVTGRFSLVARIVADGAPRTENQSGRFTLSFAGERTTLDLASPLGTTVARISSAPDEARLQVPEAGGVREVIDRDAESLAANVLGFPLPVAGLPWWIRGEPRPARAVQGAGDSFAQDGWRIAINERFESQRPRRLTLTRDSPGAVSPDATPAITLRVVLDAAP